MYKLTNSQTRAFLSCKKKNVSKKTKIPKSAKYEKKLTSVPVKFFIVV